MPNLDSTGKFGRSMDCSQLLEFRKKYKTVQQQNGKTPQGNQSQKPAFNSNRLGGGGSENGASWYYNQKGNYLIFDRFFGSSTTQSVPIVTRTVLVYSISQGNSFLWEGNTFTLDTTLPNFSYTATITSTPTSQPPNSSNLTGITLGPVTSIGDDAFKNSTIESIVIPNSVTSIGTSAFEDCTSLRSVTIPNSVRSIGALAFGECTALTSIVIPNSVTSIGAGAFNTSGLTSIVIPNSVTSIGGRAFESSGLTSVTLPDSITAINLGTFKYTPLRSVEFPDSITSIEESAFEGCTSMTTLTFTPTSTLSYIGPKAFRTCAGLTFITIPSSVTAIGEYAFGSCTALTSITFRPTSTLENIGPYAFINCMALTSITIPSTVTSIGADAFTGSALSTVTIANGQLGITSPGTGIFFFGISVRTVLP